MDTNDPLIRLLQDVHHDTRKSAKIIRDSKAKLINLQKVLPSFINKIVYWDESYCYVIEDGYVIEGKEKMT